MAPVSPAGEPSSRGDRIRARSTVNSSYVNPHLRRAGTVSLDELRRREKEKEVRMLEDAAVMIQGRFRMHKARQEMEAAMATADYESSTRMVKRISAATLISDTVRKRNQREERRKRGLARQRELQEQREAAERAQAIAAAEKETVKQRSRTRTMLDLEEQERRQRAELTAIEVAKAQEQREAEKQKKAEAQRRKDITRTLREDKTALTQVQLETQRKQEQLAQSHRDIIAAKQAAIDAERAKEEEEEDAMVAALQLQEQRQHEAFETRLNTMTKLPSWLCAPCFKRLSSVEGETTSIRWKMDHDLCTACNVYWQEAETARIAKEQKGTKAESGSPRARWRKQTKIVQRAIAVKALGNFGRTDSADEEQEALESALLAEGDRARASTMSATFGKDASKLKRRLKATQSGEGGADHDNVMSSYEWSLAQDRAMLRQELAVLFRIADEDGGGSVGTEELVEIFEAMGISVTMDNIQRLTDGVDDDGDGELDFEEMEELWWKMIHLMKQPDNENDPISLDLANTPAELFEPALEASINQRTKALLRGTTNAQRAVGYDALERTTQGLLMRQIHATFVRNKAFQLICECQRNFRAYYTAMSAAADAIRRRFLTYRERTRFVHLRRCVYFMQCWWRSMLNRRQLEEAQREQVWTRFVDGTIFVSLQDAKSRKQQAPPHGCTPSMSVDEQEKHVKKLFSKHFGRVLSVACRQRSGLNDWALVTFAEAESKERALGGPKKHGQTEWARSFALWVMEVNMQKARDSTGMFGQTCMRARRRVGQVIRQEALAKRKRDQAKRDRDQAFARLTAGVGHRENDQERRREEAALAKLLCPLSGRKLLNGEAVLAADGYTYDHQAIAHWLHSSSVSPMTGARLPNKLLLPNPKVAWQPPPPPPQSEQDVVASVARSHAQAKCREQGQQRQGQQGKPAGILKGSPVRRPASAGSRLNASGGSSGGTSYSRPRRRPQSSRARTTAASSWREGSGAGTRDTALDLPAAGQQQQQQHRHRPRPKSAGARPYPSPTPPLATGNFLDLPGSYLEQHQLEASGRFHLAAGRDLLADPSSSPSPSGWSSPRRRPGSASSARSARHGGNSSRGAHGGGGSSSSSSSSRRRPHPSSAGASTSPARRGPVATAGAGAGGGGGGGGGGANGGAIGASIPTAPASASPYGGGGGRGAKGGVGGGAGRRALSVASARKHNQQALPTPPPLWSRSLVSGSTRPS